MRQISASAVALLLDAPCSVPWYSSTPWAESKAYAARAGHAFHKACEDHVLHGPALIERIADDYGMTPRQREALRNQYRVWMAWAEPRITSRARVEIKYALDPFTGEARELKEPGERNYTAAPDGWIVGTADLVQAYEDSPVWVADWKSGGAYVAPAPENAQLQTLGAMVAGATGEPRVRLSVVRVSETDCYETEPHTTDVFDVDAHVVALGAAVERARRDERDAAPALPGPWCKARWCKVRNACEAFLAYDAGHMTDDMGRTGT